MVMTCDNCFWCKGCKTEEGVIHFCTKYDVKISEDIAHKEVECDDFELGGKEG